MTRKLTLPELFKTSYYNMMQSFKNNIEEPLYTNCLSEYNIAYNTYFPNTGMIVLWYALHSFTSYNIVIQLKNKWYEEYLKVDNPGILLKSPIYKDGFLNIKEGIREIIQWKYYMIIFDHISDTTNIEEKIKLIELLDKYANLFNVTYNKDEWNNVFG
jgi:hypothetical protein